MKTARATAVALAVSFMKMSRPEGKFCFLYKNFPWNYDKYETRPKENYSNRRRIRDWLFLTQISFPFFLSDPALILNVSRRVLENGRGNNKNWINDRTCVLNFPQVVIICTFLKKWNRNSGNSRRGYGSFNVSDSLKTIVHWHGSGIPLAPLYMHFKLNDA